MQKFLLLLSDGGLGQIVGINSAEEEEEASTKVSFQLGLRGGSPLSVCVLTAKRHI